MRGVASTRTHVNFSPSYHVRSPPPVHTVACICLQDKGIRYKLFQHLRATIRCSGWYHYALAPTPHLSTPAFLPL